MDCDQVRQQILQGRENRRAVQQHLGHCVDCQAFAQQLHETEAMLEATLPFAAPEALTHRLLAMVPQAAHELQTGAARAKSVTEQRRTTWQQVLFGLLVLSVPLALYLGVSFWEHIIGAISLLYTEVRVLLPLLATALGYGLSQLGQVVGPAFQFVLSVLVLALAVEYVVRARRRQESKMQSSF